ncbi:unnamed protein product [[Candida] boidinii]|uniref:Unnamed protein product n=1 Tax=Candida boidinii TaxID=5477 RepID=A0A9W6WJB7_CANBO|nr:unnamed protein product [[Candida] boidinii]
MLYLTLLLQLVSLLSLSNALNILVLNTSPYGIKDNKKFFKYLNNLTNHTVINISPLHFTSNFNNLNEVYIDNTNINDMDLLDSYIKNNDDDHDDSIGKSIIDSNQDFNQECNQDNDLSSLDIKLGDNWFNQPMNDNSWYVKANPLGSLLFALDHILPNYYQNTSIDLILIGPSIGTNHGMIDQSFKNVNRLLEICLMRNIPSILLNTQNRDFATSTSLDTEDEEQQQQHTDKIIQTTESSSITFPGYVYAEKIIDLIDTLETMANSANFGNRNGFHVSRNSKLIKDKSKFNNTFGKLFDLEKISTLKRLLPIGVGLKLNFPEISTLSSSSSSSTAESIEEEQQCTNPKFTKTSLLHGYNKILSLNYELKSETDFDPETESRVPTYYDDDGYKIIGSLGIELTYDMNEELLGFNSKNKILDGSISEFSVLNTCQISVTPVEFTGGEYSDAEFNILLSGVLNSINENDNDNKIDNNNNINNSNNLDTHAIVDGKHFVNQS